MMQLLCSGVELDLYEETNIQFKHENPLFAFDKIACERTTNFQLPATPTNDKVFELAKLPAYGGQAMRRKFDAQLQADGVEMSGYLYITDFDGKDYNAIFVTNEWVGLQRMKDLGKIKDLMTYDDSVRIGETLQYGYTARINGERWANILYNKPVAPLVRPSVCLAKIYNDIVAQYGLTAQILPTEAERLWLISENNGIKQVVTFKVRQIDESQPESTIPTAPYNSAESYDLLFDTESTSYGVIINSTSGSTANRYFSIVQFKAKTDLLLKIPEDWADTLYIYDFSFTHNDPDSGHFYGGRWFTSGNIFDEETHIYPHGAKLAGRKVTIKQGECFSFVDSRDYVHFRINILQKWYYNYGFFLQESNRFSNDYVVTVNTNDEWKNGDLARLQDNLPDIKFTDLVKVFAAVSGRVLTYRENGVVNWLQAAGTGLINATNTSMCVFDPMTGSLTSTRTINTRPQSNVFKVQTYNGNTPVSLIKDGLLGAGYVTFPTRLVNYDRLFIGFNGNNQDCGVFLDLNLLPGSIYTLWFNVTLLDMTDTGNDAVVSNLTLVEGSAVVTWDDWKKNAKGLIYSDIAFDDRQVEELEQITKRGKILRVFSDYAQHNIIKYKDDETVSNKITQEYTIVNDNIDEEKTLQTIPFSEGQASADVPQGVYLPASANNETLTSDAGENVLLQRVPLPKNANLQRLCDASTQIDVSARMPLFEYQRVKDNTVLFVDNQRYIWTSRNWQNSIAQFTLALLR